MDTPPALSNVEWFRRRVIVLEETESVLDQLLRLAHETKARGKQLHNLSVAAVMGVYGIEQIVTANADDYAGCSNVRPNSLSRANQLLDAGPV